MSGELKVETPLVNCACGCEPEEIWSRHDHVTWIECPKCGDTFMDHEWSSSKSLRQRWAEQQAFRISNKRSFNSSYRN